MPGVVGQQLQRQVPESTPRPAEHPRERVGGTYLVYRAPGNETALKICQRFGIHYSDLVAENTWLKDSGGHIKRDQTVLIPNVQSGSVYIVKRGDTLGQIALKHGVDFTNLANANRGRVGDEYLIHIGQVIIIPDRVQVSRPRLQLLDGPETTNATLPGVQPDSGVRLRPAPRPMSADATTTASRPASARAVSATPSDQLTAQLDISALNAASFGRGTNPYRVRLLQRMLNCAGAAELVDGDFKDKSRKALVKFQERNGLSTKPGPSGSPINDETWKALVIASKQPAGQPNVRFDVRLEELSGATASAYRLVAVLAHEDPKRLDAMLPTTRARDTQGNLVVDRSTLVTLNNRIKAYGFDLKSAGAWTYDQARAVADLVTGTFDSDSHEVGIDRDIKNHQYDVLIRRIASEETARAAREGHPMPRDFDFAAYIKAMICAESNFKDGHRSMRSPDSPYGLMQIRPSTARDVGVRDISTPEGNIRAGARYILAMQRNFKDRNASERDGCTAGAYNCGPGNMPGYLTGVPETRKHARIVTSLYNLYRATNEPRFS
ncbi:MAG: LysM peptidoglycan-binding domain-containing protein [Clostridia bacterium]|nr:LysM peptidoglycan-binding domain-containing protein [Deltaproteobacteria bacterium]